MSSAQAFQASARFGLGARQDELVQISGDPGGWIVAQLRNPQIPSEVQQRMGNAGISLKAMKAAKKQEKAGTANPELSAKEIYVQETGARFIAQLRSKQPVVERMVLFWSNHFTVSIQKPIIAGLVNAYEVEAIRPHIGGYFHEMVLATAKHPAMLLYLDNAKSFGPKSRAARNGRGRNENYARELLELHTLGVGGGYTQSDVIALADILTGWTLARGTDGPLPQYQFQPLAHEPGNKQLLGQAFYEEGEQEGVKAIRMLCSHPATATHIATKLVQHFVSDMPPANAVAAVAKVFRDSNGHLPSVMEAVLALPDAWQPLKKIRTPYEFILAALRATNIEPTAPQVISALDALNFRAFNAASPAGYDDVATTWISPDALTKRIEWAHKLSQRLPGDVDPMKLAEKTVGPVMRVETRQAIERAASGKDGVALLLASPEFQRR